MDRSPEGLRLRQLDRLSPRSRGSFGIGGGISISVREVDQLPRNGINLAPAPSPESARKKQPEGYRKEGTVFRRANREAEDLKHEIAPDGGSAGREGRQFTVANVGNNGRIYLRPTIRPATQQHPQPNFVFPITPPSTAGLDALISQNEVGEPLRDSLWTPTQSPPTPLPPNSTGYFEQATRTAHGRPRRAFSQSTIDKHQVQSSVRDSDIGAFRVVIERPGTEQKQNEPFIGIPHLKIPIPSYKLGTPRFSTRGTAFLRGSSYTMNDDVRSSIFSGAGASRRSTGPDPRARALSRRHSDALPQRLHPAAASSSPYLLSTSRSPATTRQCTSIVPDMFDDLTFKPACDEAAVVLYHAGDGGIRAATPARLVAEITSPTFVDYDLLSDFFLTFRSFLDTSDLLYMLIARLKWALMRTDEAGNVVRVRTFVAIRHWILNYFLDDYVIDYDLRNAFCDLLNKFVSGISGDPAHLKVPLKILGELKKCWRRACALYWDGEEFNTELGLDVPITSGGVAGSRNPNLDPSFWAKDSAGPPRLDDIIEPDFFSPENSTMEKWNYFADVSRAGHLDSVIGPSKAKSTFYIDHQNGDPPLSPTSVMSDDFISCSFPTRGRIGSAKPLGAKPLGAHPVPASSIYDSAPPIAMTPRALTGKRVRPAHAHKRSASFSDSLRDKRIQQQPVQKVLYKSTEILLALPYAGSLVRGNLFPPAQGFVETVAPRTPAEANRTTTSLPGILAGHKGPSAMSGPGMKKLLGSVRRALSTKSGGYANSSPTQGSFPHIPPIGMRGATINRLPGTAVVPQAPPRNAGPELSMRIDLLGAEIAEHFKRAVQEDADADFERRGEQENARRSIDTYSSMHDPDLHYSVMCPDTTIEPVRADLNRGPISEMTTGSKSILIMDDTIPDIPVMTGALPANRSEDTFAEAYNHSSGGLTPPSTPPDAPLGMPRRSSHLLGEHTRIRSHSLSFDDTPSLVVDSRPSGDDERSPFNRPFGRPSVRSRAYSHSYKNSVSLRKYASYQSGFTLHRSEISFDATTFSGTEKVDRLSQVASVPLPLRVLRRRPGGDLRAVTNVGDLGIHQLQRPMSTGSLATYSESVRSSLLLGADDSGSYIDVAGSSSYDQSRANDNAFSLGALAEAAPKPAASLFSTHSSQPVMRPSFAKEAKYLAQIPDDIDDDGGVESALLKLEGKFEKRKSDSSQEEHSKRDVGTHDSFGATNLDVSSFAFNLAEDERRKHRLKHIVDSNISAMPSTVQASRYSQMGEEPKPFVLQPNRAHHQPTQSMDSYDSNPLLDRGMTDDGKEQKQSQNWSQHSIQCGPSNDGINGQYQRTPQSSHTNSYDFINETNSMKRGGQSHSKTSNKSMTQSFLDMDSNLDDKSDLSSEISLEVISRSEYTPQHSKPTEIFSPIHASTVSKAISLPEQSSQSILSPSLTLVQALMLSPREIDTQQMHKRFPPTPQISPIAAKATTFSGDRGGTSSMNPPRSHRMAEPSRKTSIHLPFILAFDSRILAQQFTLVEKDALNEIDWKDLIEMPWKDSITESRSWVDFLRFSEPRGVEVVIARFNLMVKWAVSEIVLTQDLDERVRCIVKYIHIAAHCRKYRNFATMTQLTVALTSNDISRLTKTWAGVPAADMHILKELEALVTPMSNFYNLRAEMEGYGAGQGCIPFIGIYTHDLLVNAERPSQFASTPTTDPLVNFERCRTDAAIVKNLLRLLEASQLYRFLPVEGITERCLWMAALSDEEISRYGKVIQP
ncbi:hypothetical protein BJ878DRAFT_522787 [Calycina marina]|uniref:Guanine nucleotide exchange factor LTE1 n=1 Tax=Calycina marina TaxID=1763456 RepID=A0A9P7YW10_9HELO|nr:hypothetical protein BJ878DRAFT_522787 [Calycina marina]